MYKLDVSERYAIYNILHKVIVFCEIYFLCKKLYSCSPAIRID